MQAFYAAEAVLEWVVQELRGVQDWHGLSAGIVRSRIGGAMRVQLADGTVLDLQDETDQLEQTGAGATAAGRGLRWQLYAHGPLGALLPIDPSNGLLFVAVWLADDPRRAETDSLVVHAAVRGPALTHRAVQATVRRRAMSQPATLPPLSSCPGGLFGSCHPGLAFVA